MAFVERVSIPSCGEDRITDLTQLAVLRRSAGSTAVRPYQSTQQLNSTH
jgi:hypothetical protein